MAATVYHTALTTPQSLVDVYEKLGHIATGKVAVTLPISRSGPQAGGLTPQLVQALVQLVDGTIVVSNAASGDQPRDPADRLKLAQEQGFAAIAPVEALDAVGTIDLPVRSGGRLSRDIVGAHLQNFDHLIVLSPASAQTAGGVGGAIATTALSLAALAGEATIPPSSGAASAPAGPVDDSFLEALAEAAVAVSDFFGPHIIYLNVAGPAAGSGVEAAGAGVLSSLDPVALDQATAELLQGGGQPTADFAGLHIVEWAERLGLGSRDYQLVQF